MADRINNVCPVTQAGRGQKLLIDYYFPFYICGSYQLYTKSFLFPSFKDSRATALLPWMFHTPCKKDWCHNCYVYLRSVMKQNSLKPHITFNFDGLVYDRGSAAHIVHIYWNYRHDKAAKWFHKLEELKTWI